MDGIILKKVFLDVRFMKLILFLLFIPLLSFGQKDTVVYRYTYKDTIVYNVVNDTIRRKIIHYYSDTVSAEYIDKKKAVLNPDNFGFGPSLGAYYSPYHGFDVIFGFSIQYCFFSAQTFRKPTFKNKRSR